MRVDPRSALGTQNDPRKGNHVGNVNPKGTVTTSAQHTILPDELLHPFQKVTVYLAPFFIQLAQGINHLIGRHVMGILVITHKKKTALRTQGTACAGSKAEFHSGFFLL